ncbi:MarR family winged helix-turn-helix transcriptional regulator [Parasedimentitalea huanghaiensis]|uniref:MarR family transcriptional regulator n=1 Tax=Parasedimentitalea huanghaiensis TaxID=2682100 RepID=A0A6L6WMH2_9RHOB|nr:MarR family transcriptional regulator [Zongyanglinia huanghaiensis]MVO18691.1 MarR family transcriptional regulator [Zongyanglinia huanghaiensis]
MTTKRNRGGDAVSNLLLATFKLNGAFLAAGDKISAPSGLTSARWQVLGTLMWDDMTVSGIAREMGLSRQAVQRIANVLAKENLITFLDNPNDKRAKLASATDEGRKAIQSLAERQHAWANATATGIDPAEIERAVEVMKKVLVASK